MLQGMHHIVEGCLVPQLVLEILVRQHHAVSGTTTSGVGSRG
jgi:hypothetical protein